MDGELHASASAVATAASTLGDASVIPSLVAREMEPRASTVLDFNTTSGLPPVRPPPGIVPELQNPPRAGQGGNLAGLGICISVATILFAVRLYVKFRIRRNYLVEDGECLLVLKED